MSVVSDDGLPGEDLRMWMADQFDAESENWQRLDSGNSRVTWSVDLVGPQGTVGAIVQLDDGYGPLSGTELSLSREASVYRALDNLDPRIPKLLGQSDNIIVVSRLPGAGGWNQSILAGLLDLLACLHQVPIEQLELPGFARTARADLDVWKRVIDMTVETPSQFIQVAFTVLGEQFPGEPTHMVLCHGDAGVGNVLNCQGEVSGLVDWEFAHLGDPIDDLAWITVRAVLFGVELDGFDGAIEHFAKRCDLDLDPRRLMYWQAVVLLRNLICCESVIAKKDPKRDKLVHLMLIPTLHRLLVSALARLVGVEIVPTPSINVSRSELLPGEAALMEVSRQLDVLSRENIAADQMRSVKRMRRMLSQFARTWPLAAEAGRLNAAQNVEGADIATRLQQLSDCAERELELFPQSLGVARVPLAVFQIN